MTSYLALPYYLLRVLGQRSSPDKGVALTRLTPFSAPPATAETLFKAQSLCPFILSLALQPLAPDNDLVLVF